MWLIFVRWFLIMFAGRHILLGRWRGGRLSTRAVAIAIGLIWGSLPSMFALSNVTREPVSSAALILLTIASSVVSAVATVVILRHLGPRFGP